MWASFVLFSSDSHHFSSSVQRLISSVWSLVSCCMHAGNDLMPGHPVMTRLFREVRWPSHSGSADMLSHHCNLNDSREVRCRMLSGTFVRWSPEIVNSRRAGKWWNSLMLWLESSFIVKSNLMAPLEEEQWWLVMSTSSNDEITWSLLYIMHSRNVGGHGFNLNLGQP